MEETNDTFSINFTEFWRILKKEKILILTIVALFSAAGLIYGFSAQEEFISEGKILPEIQGKSGSMSQLSGLAALAGVDLGGAGAISDAIRPDLYPDVLNSTPFFLELIDKEFSSRNNKKNTVRKILTKDFSKIPAKDLKLLYPKSNDYITYNKFTGSIIKDLKSRISCIYDKKSGVISISVKLPDPIIAAEVTNFSMKYLTNYMINYRTEKQKKDLNFLAERLANAKGKYYSNQERKASYSDQLPISALRLQTADLQRERIEGDYKISSTFYNSLLQKYEEAKLKMQQETPVIQVLEPAVAPNLKSAPRKAFILLFSFFVGSLVALLISIIKGKNYNKIFYAN